MAEFDLPDEVERQIAGVHAKPGRKKKVRTVEEVAELIVKRKAFCREYMRAYQRVPYVKTRRYRRSRRNMISKVVSVIGDHHEHTCMLCNVLVPVYAMVILPDKERVLAVCLNCKRRWVWEGGDLDTVRKALNSGTSVKIAEAVPAAEAPPPNEPSPAENKEKELNGDLEGL